jgi:hypothetical protein
MVRFLALVGDSSKPGQSAADQADRLSVAKNLSPLASKKGQERSFRPGQNLRSAKTALRMTPFWGWHCLVLLRVTRLVLPWALEGPTCSSKVKRRKTSAGLPHSIVSLAK